MEGFKPTKSPQATRGENIGAQLEDAGPMLAEQLLRNGDEVFESEETGKSYVLNERMRKRSAAKANKQDAMHAKQRAAMDIQIKAEGSLKPTNIPKPLPQPSIDKPVAALESQQTVLTATARSHGIKATTHQDAVRGLKEEKMEIKQQKADEKKDKSKHAKKEEKRREAEHSQNKSLI